MTVQEIIAAAAVKADHINALLKAKIVMPSGEVLRIYTEPFERHNQKSWASQDLEADGQPKSVWEPLKEEAYEAVKGMGR